MVAFDLSLQPPIAVLADLVDDMGIGGCVGSDGLEEPGWDDVRGGLVGNGWLSVKLVKMDVVVGTSESPLDEACAG